MREPSLSSRPAQGLPGASVLEACALTAGSGRFPLYAASANGDSCVCEPLATLDVGLAGFESDSAASASFSLMAGRLSRLDSRPSLGKVATCSTKHVCAGMHTRCCSPALLVLSKEWLQTVLCEGDIADTDWPL